MLLFDHEMVQLLTAYLRVDTSHPNPNYEQAYSLLQQQADRDGLQTMRIALPSGRDVVVISLPGLQKSGGALALVHHVDVVPADATLCKYNPFGGHIVDGIMYGRGTQDMKGVGITHYAALRALKRACIVPQHTIHLLAVPDEELGGFTGTGQLIKTEAFAELGIQYVLDEGRPSGLSDGLFIKVSERRPLQVRFTATGALAHASNQYAHNALHELMRFCNRLIEASTEASVHVTSLHAGQEATYNVVPASAQAIVDMRIPMHVTNQAVLDLINTELQLSKMITYEILASVQDYQCHDQTATELFKTVQRAITKQGLRPMVQHATEASDLRFYWMQGLVGLGLTPFTVQENLHGVDEAVPLADLELGARIFFEIIQTFCIEG